MEIITRAEAKEQGLKHYFTGKPCKRGHVDKRFVSGFQCVVCAKMHYDERRKQNPEAYKKAQRKHYANNREKCIAATMESQKRNRSGHLARKRRYNHAAKSRDPERFRQYHRGYQRERNKADPEFRMRKACLNMLHRVLDRTGCAKSDRAERMVGYSKKQLLRHIESNMTEGMNWSNYGQVWQIDHVISVAEMIRLGVTDPAKINALSNLMPEYKEVNISKSDKFSLSAPPVL